MTERIEDELLVKARKLRDEGRINDALAVFQSIVEKGFATGEIMHEIGLLQHNSGRLKIARQCFLKAIDLDSTQPSYHNNLGTLLTRTGNQNGAIECFRNAVRLDPDYMMALGNLGAALKSADETEEAEKILVRVVNARPDWVFPMMNLGSLYLSQHRNDEGRRLLEKVIDIEPGNEVVKHQLSVLNNETPDNAPAEFVRNLFDQYSSAFDQQLTNKLGYRTPTLLRDLCLDVFGENAHFPQVADLGCGTGLSGEAFRPLSGRLLGVDLSPGMVAEAEKKKIYDELYSEDIVIWLCDQDNKFDFAVAADVLVYMGNLKSLFLAMHNRLTTGGYFAFSVEKHDGDGFVLRKTARYAHSLSYLEPLLQSSGYEMVRHEEIQLRKDHGKWIIGYIFLVRAVHNEP